MPAPIPSLRKEAMGGRRANFSTPNYSSSFLFTRRLAGRVYPRILLSVTLSPAYGGKQRGPIISIAKQTHSFIILVFYRNFNMIFYVKIEHCKINEI
jgi:hypothetical protein